MRHIVACPSVSGSSPHGVIAGSDRKVLVLDAEPRVALPAGLIHYRSGSQLVDALGLAGSEHSDLWDLVRFALDNVTPQEIAQRSGISILTLKSIRNRAIPMTSPPPGLVAACAGVCRSRLRRAGMEVPQSHRDVLELYRDARQQDLARLSSMEHELKLLESEQRSDPHARFRYWHDLTGYWKRKTVHTRYHGATMDNPRGRRSSWAKPRAVASVLSRVCAELGEDFSAFTQRVCHAVHGRPNRITLLRHAIHSLRERLAEGRLLPRAST
jgi:hypothetical protein